MRRIIVLARRVWGARLGHLRSSVHVVLIWCWSSVAVLLWVLVVLSLVSLQVAGCSI